MATIQSAAYGMVIHNNQTNIFTVPKQATNTATLYLSAITISGNAIIYATPGEGF